MAKIRYIPEDTDRMDQKREERNARKKAFNAPCAPDQEPEELPDDVQSLDAFAEFLIDGEDREEYTHLELREMCFRLHVSSHVVKDAMDTYGLRLAKRVLPQSVRGFSSWDNNKYAQSGMSGGSGWDAIIGTVATKN